MTIALVTPRSRAILCSTGGALLLLLGVAYLLVGAHRLSFGTDWSVDGVDLSQRWRETRYVLKGQNPLDVSATWYSIRDGTPPPDIGGRDGTMDWSIGFPSNGGYPPWAYAIGAPFMWSVHWDFTRRLWTGVNLLAAAVLGLWAWAELRPHGRSVALLAAGSALAIGGGCTAVRYGQWTLPVVGAAAAAVWLSRRRIVVGRLGAGMGLAIAFAKVTLTGPLGTAFLARTRWLTLLTTAVLLTLASLAVCSRVKTPPLEMLGQMADNGATYAHKGYDAAGLLIALGVPADDALKPAALGVVAIAAALHLWGRRRDLLWHVAVAAVAGRFWTYHKGYDNPILAFLIVALLAAAVRSKRPLAWVGFAIVGLSLWIPPLPEDADVAHAIQSVAWLFGLCVLVATPFPEREPTGAAVADEGHGDQAPQPSV